MSLYVPVFEALNATQVRYVVVGGFATVLHGYARLTADIESIDALAGYGMVPRPPVDLFVEHPIEFDLVWSRAEVVALGPVCVRIASIPDLIALKRLANRPQDVIDIEKLTEIQSLKKHRDDE
jgi:hypothetical protein